MTPQLLEDLASTYYAEAGAQTSIVEASRLIAIGGELDSLAADARTRELRALCVPPPRDTIRGTGGPTRRLW